ncbi:nitroreductase/quinone reductase family protein [Amycolatopsis anabasis]|uniref:nitroreductase/quinone reductase family protein n=1 Tax=Amycolatopsis anabasis TaxID=1840409 RepID=UPI001FE56062|nr:nitroreductase/quinone reductase family protein [Amycolatopsis anabasis]
MTLEVPGRRTRRTTAVPLALAEHEGERYLVAILGADTHWVRNVHANGNRGVLRRGRRETVQLEEVDPGDSAPILRHYLTCAPGARPHLPVDQRAALEDFERIAPQFPVFRLSTDIPVTEKNPRDDFESGEERT